ncbi:hypothetical protein D9619_006696 [Psilocybe cf. subviscida]|uniref:Uncharacterized protein n=1 Tax=Psilocybe cf. subviscida TaxID=2480587 RepID=A0A8H5B455_9AGAR|nr:hypothetical protein D9619_006696 [Psilocybe cf. subviscida]
MSVLKKWSSGSVPSLALASSCVPADTAFPNLRRITGNGLLADQFDVMWRIIFSARQTLKVLEIYGTHCTAYHVSSVSDFEHLSYAGTLFLPQMDFFRVPEPLLQLVYIQLDLELCRRDEVLTLEGALLLAKDATWNNLDHILTSNLFPSMKTVGLRLRFNLHHRQQTVMLPEIKSALLWSFSQLDKSSAIEFTLYVD